MKTERVKNHYGLKDVYNITLKYFGAHKKNRILYIIAVILLTFCKNTTNYYIKVFVNECRKESNHTNLGTILFKILIACSFVATGNFFTDYTFQKLMIPYGGQLASVCLRNFLYSDSYSKYNYKSDVVEYYVGEGSKELAKLTRDILLNLTSSCIHFIWDMLFLSENDKSKYYVVTIFASIVSCLAVIIKYRIFKSLIPLYHSENQLAGEREKIFTENFNNLKIIESYGQVEHSVGKYENRSREWADGFLKLKKTTYFNNFLYTMTMYISAFVACFFYLKNVEDSDGRDLMVVYRQICDLILTAAKFVNLFLNVNESLTISQELIKYLNLARESPENKIRVDKFHDKISIVDATYSIGGRVIFSKINFDIKKGEKIAMYGRNGAGKSSIFKLIMNYDDFLGEILFDDVDIRKIYSPSYKSLICHVPQQTVLFDDTIYYNLSYGNTATYEEVVKECKMMNIHDKIMQFPNGYNTVVGEGGMDLNGGLKQKIFYARAFLCDREIYLLDEPTNNLDEQATHSLLEYINSPRFDGKTFFVICHDRNFISRFEKILKFGDLKIEIEKTQ